MAQEGDSDARVARYVRGVSLVGMAAVLAEAIVLAGDTLRHGRFLVEPSHAAIALVVAGILVLLHRYPFTFYWREHRLVVSLDEAAVLVALITIPAPLVAMCVPVATAIVQAWSGPAARIKRIFNVSQYSIAAAVTSLLFLALLATGLPKIVAATGASLAFGTTANILLAGVFSRLSGESAPRVFRERFLLQGANSALVGLSGGLMLVALWSMHPLAVLAALPFAVLVRRYWKLYAGADRELEVHRRLANATRELVGTSSATAVAERVLGECERLLDCGRAQVVLRLGPLDETMASDYGSGPQRHASPIVESLPAREGGTLGDLTVWPRQGKEAFGEQEQALVRTIAAQAASAIENARAIGRLDTYLSTAPDAVLLVEPDGRISYANPAARTLFGLETNVMTCRASDFFEDPRLTGVPDVPLLVDAKAHDLVGARRFDVEAHVGPVTEAGRVTGALMVVRDISERRRVEEEMARQRAALAQSEKLSVLGTMVASVAHEINNPLTFMRGNLQLCRDSIAMRMAASGISPEERQLLDDLAGEVKIALDGVDRITGIAQSLKGVSKRGATESRPEDLNLVVTEVAHAVRAGMPREVRLETDLAEGLPSVHARHGELHQVLLNLVKNAVEALEGRDDGWVRVRSFVDGKHVVVEVADNGAGIPAEVQRSLFTAFFTTKEKGTGLGLSISRGIVQAHGGELSLASEVGQGTTFTLRLPVAVAPVPRA